MTLLSDVDKLSRDVARLGAMVEATSKMAESHELQISGDRGISVTLVALADEIHALSISVDKQIARVLRAAYWVAGIIVAGAITLAFSALKLSGHS